MRFNSTPEIDELEKQFTPYISPKGSGFIPGTPQSAIDAKKKYIELVKARYEEALKYVM